jgi:hypothetical protein
MDRQVYKKVENITFGIFSPKQIMDLAAVNFMIEKVILLMVV